MDGKQAFYFKLNKVLMIIISITVTTSMGPIFSWGSYSMLCVKSVVRHMVIIVVSVYKDAGGCVCVCRGGVLCVLSVRW